MSRTAIVVGANGLIGSQLLTLLLDSGYYRTVVSLTRKFLEIKHERLVQCIIEDFNALDEFEEMIAADDIYCCLGSTMKKAGSKDAFRKIDYDYPLRIAQLAAMNETQQFLVVSSTGANSNSKAFYTKVKGEIEEALKQVDFKSLHIFRPSLLLGPREEKRSGESTAKSLMTTFSFLMIGPWKKYKPIESLKVAKAMFKMAKENKEGIFTYESDELQTMA